MSDIARLGVVVEQSGIETTLKGLDAIAAKMKAIETSKVSPVSTPKGGSTATASLAKEEFKLTAFKEKEAEKRLTVAEKSAAKEKDIALKTNSAKEVIEARTAAYRKVLADKAESEAIKHNQQMAFIHKRSQDGILRIEEKTKADILKIREKADSDLIKQSSKLNNDLVRMSTAQSLRIAEQEAKNTSNLSAISQKELEKRITEQTRATTRIETEKAKSATRIEQIEAANQAKIQQIRERTAAYAEKLQMREELAARRSIEQQGKAYSSLADIANKARNVMAVAFAGYGITEAVGAVIKTADAMTELNARLRLVTQSSTELKQVQMDLFRVSQSSGTSIKDNSEIYFGLARATKTLGTSQKELIFLTEGLGKAAIVSGASTQSFKAAMFQLRQALESGVLRGQEFNSISEQAPRVLQAIGEGLGKTTGELRKMAGEGQLTTDVVLPALMKGLQSVNKEFDSLPTTVSRATMMVENSFSMLVARANEASKGTSTLAEVIKNISSAMDSISTDNITTAMNAAGVAVNGLALALSGKLIQALGAAAVAKVASIKADMGMVRSNATVAASELQKAQAASVAAAEKVRAAAMEVEAANAAVAAAERVVLAEEASRMSMLKTLAAREALTAAQAKAAAASQASVAATTAMTASNNAAATAADAHAVAQARLAAAGTATGRVMSGLGVIFNAMGGWVTVAIGVIWGLVTVWDAVANSAQRAKKEQQDAIIRARQAESISGAMAEEKMASEKVSKIQERVTGREKALEIRLSQGLSKDSNEYRQRKAIIDQDKQDLTAWRNTQIKTYNEVKSKSAELADKVIGGLKDEKNSAEDVVKSYKEGVKVKSEQQRKSEDLLDLDKRVKESLSKLDKKPTPEEIRLGTYDPNKNAKAVAEINRLANEERKLIEEKYAKKEGGAKKPKAPELSAGYEAALSYTQEQLEVINKMASAQEKLLGYIKPELLERKQSLEAEKERENTVAKIAKIQEQLNKKNLGKGVAGQLKEQLKIYQQQKDAISQELVVTQALQREQNNLKIYEMDVLRIAQQKNELQKAYLDAAVATGSLSGQEAKQQEQLNALKMIEIEYAGKIIEAQKTYDLMVKNRYTEEAEASKLRLDSLISERDTKLEVAKIKMYSDKEARTFEAGWRRAWGTYKDEASNASSFGEKVMGDALKGIEDAFYAMMSGTKVSFKDLWKSILSDMNRYFARQLTSTIADAIIEGFRTPQDAGFSVNVSGGQGQSVAQQVVGASSKGFDVLDIFSNSKSSYDATINKALTSSIGQSLGFSQTPISSATTSMFVEGSQSIYGFTDAAAATGAELTSLGQAASTAGQALGYLPSVMQATEGKYISAAGSAIGQYFGGPIGSMAGAAIGGLLDDAFGFGEKKPDERKAKFGYGASDALREEGLRTGWTGSSVFGEFRTYNDKWFSDSEMRPAMSAFVDSLENLDNAVADSLKLTADQTTNAIDALKAIDKEYSFGLQWGDFTENSKAREQIAVDRYATILDSVEQGWGDFVRGFTGSFDQFPAYLQSIIQAMQQFRDAGGDVTRVFGQQVNSIKEFERFAKSGETSASAFQRLYGVFQITNRVMESLGKSTKGANLATADLRENFVRLAGGMEQLQGYLTEYYEGFYTEAERTSVVMADLQKEFDKYGATVPKTREEWRKLMESLDLSTESGQQAAVKLYQLQGAFLSITPEIESATEAAKDFKDEIADLERYFRDQLSAVDYSGMTEQGQQAARALDELTSKLARLSEIGGDVDLGIQAISRYIKTEIPKLYADALAPFKQAGGRGYTDLGKSIFEILSQAKTAARAITEINNAELSASHKLLGWQQSEANTVAAKSAKSVSFGGTKDYGIVRETGYKSSLDKLLDKYLTEAGYSREQIENFGRGMLDANGNFVDDESKWSDNKWLYDQFKQEAANLGRVSDSEIKAFIQSGKTNEQIYDAAQEFGISAARLSEVLGISKEEIKSWVAANGLAQLTPDEVYRSSAEYNPDKKAIEILDSVSGLLTVVQAGTGGIDYANLDRLAVDPKEWQKAVADMLQALPANADYIMQDAINYAPSKFLSAGADKSFLRDYSDIDVTKDWSSLFSNPDMPSVQSFAEAAGLDFKTASDMLNSSGIVLNGLIDWAKVMTSSDPAKSLQGALNAISEDQTLMKLQNKWQQTQGYSNVGDVSGIPQFVDTVIPAIETVTEKAVEKIKEISASEVMSAADPVNALLQQTIGRDASAEERKQIEDAYNWGIANGKAVQDIVNDIAGHAVKLEQAVEEQVVATEKATAAATAAAATTATAATAAQSVNNAPVHAGSYIQPSYDPSRLRQIEEDQKARERYLAAIKELSNGFLSSVYDEMQSSFDAINKESQMIGLSEIGRAAKDATSLLKDRMQSVVDVITLTAEGLKEIGVADLLAKSKEFADAYIAGTIKTTEELQSSLDSLFEGVDGAEGIKKSVIESAESSRKLFDDTAKQLREQLVAPWQSAYESLASNSIDAEINAAITAKDQALADAKTLAESMGQNFDDLAKEIQRGFDAQLFGLTKQKLQGVIDSISKITDFQTGIDDAIFGLRTGMEGADIVGLYKQREAEIRSQLAESMQGENLDEQIDLANQLKDVIDQRYSVEFENQKRLIEFADNLSEYLRRLRVSDKSTGSVFDRLTEARRQFDEDLRLSRGTGKEAEAARGRITNSSDTLLELARQFYGNNQGYTDIYNNVVGGLEGLQIDTRTEAEKALSVAQEGNDHALKQIAELQALRGTFDNKLGVLQQQQATYIVEMQKLAGQLGLSQSAILQALKDLPSGISGAIAGTMPMPAVGSTGGVAAISQPAGTTLSRNAISDLLDRYLDIGGWNSSKGVISESDIQNTAASVGISAGDVRAIIETNKINGSHATGLDYVPFDGYTAELHKGEMVLDANTSDALRKYGVNVKYSQDQMKVMMQPANDDASKQQLIQEVKRLNASLEKLRQEVALQGQSDRQQRGEIASRQEGMQKQQIVSTMRLTASNI